jgi:hypothetical protein
MLFFPLRALANMRVTRGNKIRGEPASGLTASNGSGVKIGTLA